MSRLFTAPDTWAGGFYQLAIELGARSDGRLQTALETIWRHRDLDGCYADTDVEPADQARISPSLEARLQGVVTFPDGGRIACGTSTIREEDGSDWICFYLPMGALSAAYPVGAYPFGEDASETCRSWREPLDEWLVQMAEAVFAATPFSLALIGHELSGEAYAQDLRTTGIPEERWFGYLWRERERLVWYPPSRYESDYT